jgi:hypothetical protein
MWQIATECSWNLQGQTVHNQEKALEMDIWQQEICKDLVSRSRPEVMWIPNTFSNQITSCEVAFCVDLKVGLALLDILPT